MELVEHEHPLNLIDLQPSYPDYEEIYSDEEEENKVLITKQDFRCQCDKCGLEINYFHRYYYRCDQCNYSLHKCCGAKLPATLEHASHPHQTLSLLQSPPVLQLPVNKIRVPCSICREDKNLELDLCYCCVPCGFVIHLDCVCKERAKNETIYHPSHQHPLMPIPGPILAKCNACRKKHVGIFYLCITCHSFLIHKNCVFLPKNLSIQHTHPLTLAYTFPMSEQRAKNSPRCRLCNGDFLHFFVENFWIYKCEKCRYYTHLDCATSRKKPFQSIFMKPGTRKLLKNFEDDDYPALLHLPFPDQTYNIQKYLFSKVIESPRELDTNEIMKKYHQHPLILVDTQGSWPTSSRTTTTTKLSSCHDPMKNVQLLCNGCFCPIMTMPFFKCAQGCNFVLHEWCTQLPSELKDHPCHSQHTLTLQSHDSRDPLGVFYCDVCNLCCNGFSYSCTKCAFFIDVNCAFMPEKITHEAHRDHPISRLRVENHKFRFCHMCKFLIKHFSWSCVACDFHLHPACALLLPKTIRHKLDKHPMKLSYFPIENHKSDYFCEVCEEKLDPTRSFYHCHECAWSIHSSCAPLILGYERNIYLNSHPRGVYIYVNIKFGGIHKIEGHTHPLTFSQGIQSDGGCLSCSQRLGNKLIFKCHECKFAVHVWCCKIMKD